MDTGITIYYVPTDGKAWASYIKDKLVSQPYEINCELFIVSPNEQDFKLPQSRVNVFFLTPDFLEHSNWELLLNLDRNTTIIALTGVERDDLVLAVTDINYDILKEHIVCDLEQNDESVRDLIIAIISVYELDEAPETPVPNSDSDVITTVFNYDVDIDSNHYCVLPKPRQVNALHDVFFKDGKVYVLLDRPTDGALTFKIAGYKEIHPGTTQYAVYAFPFNGLTNPNSTISVFQEHSKLGECAINTHRNKTTSNASATSKDQVDTKSCVLKSFSDNSSQTSTCFEDCERNLDRSRDLCVANRTGPPAPCIRKDNAYVNITPQSDVVELVSASSLNRATKLAKIRELMDDETDPIQLFCDCLLLEKKIEQLDKKLASMIECSEMSKHLCDSRADCQEETAQSTWPTLVHFGAQYNLVSFCDSLLRNPLMHHSCVRANKDGHRPHDLARHHGHTRLADMLQEVAECVRANKEGKYDSGFSAGIVGTPRSSLITHYSERQPRNDEVHINAPQDGVLDIGATPMRTRRGNLESPRLSRSLKEDQTDGKKELLNRRKTVTKHKDIDVKEDTKVKKKGIFHGLFKGKKARSKSDPNFFPPSPTAVYRQHNGGRSDTHTSAQNSTYSSEASSSTASTYSTESYSNKDGDDFEVEKRNFGKKKAKTRIPFILKNAKRRQSVRIKHAIEDTNLTPPHIPLKKNVHVLFF